MQGDQLALAVQVFLEITRIFLPKIYLAFEGRITACTPLKAY